MKQRLKIQGMHCTSCAMNIDGALEDLPGVQEASTSYARGQLDVSFEPAQVTLEQIIATIEGGPVPFLPAWKKLLVKPLFFKEENSKYIEEWVH